MGAATGGWQQGNLNDKITSTVKAEHYNHNNDQSISTVVCVGPITSYRLQLTLFLQHLNLHVFYCRIVGVVNGVVVSTVIVLIAETARIKHVLS